MNFKTLLSTSLLVLTTGVAGVAMAASGARGGAYPAEPSGPGVGHPAQSAAAEHHMGMGSCPMMGNAHLNGKDAMQMHAEMVPAMSDTLRKYADKAGTPAH